MDSTGYTSLYEITYKRRLKQLQTTTVENTIENSTINKVCGRHKMYNYQGIQ